MAARKPKKRGRARGESQTADVALADRKIQPKLRMIAGGSKFVNTLRAEHSAALYIKDGKYLDKNPQQRGIAAVPLKRDRLSVADRGKILESLKRPPRDVFVNLFIEMADVSDKASAKGIDISEDEFKITKRKGNIATARASLSVLEKLASDPRVTYIEMGESLVDPKPHVVSKSSAVPQGARCPAALKHLHGNGRGVLIGIIDVQGFDFAHEDFLYKQRGTKQQRTRFVRIWDQGAKAGDSSKPGQKQPFGYGLEYDEDDLNGALKDSLKVNVPPHMLAPQSQMVEGSHGTHVASIAAGKTGCCTEADIAAVLISLPPRKSKPLKKRRGEESYDTEEADYRDTFYDSTRVVHAVEYLLDLAEERKQPIAINISLGTNGHAHDATSSISRWIDSALTVPGRCVCVAAGNAGQEAPAFEGDRNYFMGRIHTSGTIPSNGLATDIEWLVAGNTVTDISENELEIWYSPQDRFEVMLKPPGGRWYGPVKPGKFVQNLQLPDGSLISIYNELYHPANGSNYISIYLSPCFMKKGVVGVPAGQWTVRLRGDQVRDGRFHGWIERDDPRPLGRRVGDKEAWSFPSFFSARSNVDDCSIGSLACGLRVISVGNLDDEAECINVSSSQGPTRDGRYKPDVVAPGTNIIAAKGFTGADASSPDAWIKMSGTSMASPYVTGVVGLMLAAQKNKKGKNLTAAQIEGIIKRTAVPLTGSSYAWANDAGFGRIDPAACIKEAAEINDRSEEKEIV